METLEPDAAALGKELTVLTEIMKRQTETLDDTRKQMHDAIVAALVAGVRQAEIARLTGYSRDWVMKVANRAGVGIHREPRLESEPAAAAG